MSTIYYDIECDFTQIPNHIILNPKISGTAKAIYFYIVMRLRQNAKWEFYDFDIMEHLKEGRDSFRNAKKELLEYGYLVKVKQNIGNDGKYKGCDYAIKKEPITENPTSAKPKTDEPISENPSANNKKQNNNINNKQSKKDNTNTASGVSNKKEIPVSANFTHTQPTVKESLTIEPTCKETLQVESVAGHKNYIHNTQKKSGRDIYTIEFEEFWAKYCEIAKAKNYTAGDKKTANKCYLKVLQKRRHQDIMRVLTIYQEFILLAFENNKHASSWLNAIDWPDFENQIKQYETDIVNLKNKAKQKEQNSSGQKLIQKPVYEVSEEDKKKQEQELKEYAKVKTEKPQFMEHFKSVLKNYYGSSHFSWIQSLKMKSINENEVVFMLQCQVYVDVIQRNNERFEQVFNREFQGFYKEFDGVIKFVTWKI